MPGCDVNTCLVTWSLRAWQSVTDWSSNPLVTWFNLGIELKQLKGAQFSKFIDSNTIVFHFYLLCVFGGKACGSSGTPYRGSVSATIAVKFGLPFWTIKLQTNRRYFVWAQTHSLKYHRACHLYSPVFRQGRASFNITSFAGCWAECHPAFHDWIFLGTVITQVIALMPGTTKLCSQKRTAVLGKANFWGGWGGEWDENCGCSCKRA